jgi:beta-galactosidase/beta-glucuronidase
MLKRSVVNILYLGSMLIQLLLICRIFKVNGEPIFVRGGNWILSDGLLRLTKKRYMTDIKFHADMNFNMLRCWGGGLAERPDFYHFCDVYGLMVILCHSKLVIMV